MYAALGLSAVIFIVHSIILYGVALQYKRLSLGWIAGMAGLNFLGALAYSLRKRRETETNERTNTQQIPEKYFPGRFDIYGNSHQILHCMVVLAALAHFAGLVQSFDYLHSGGGEECSVR
ncbi:similar to adiponectin receptor-1 [Botrytis cinerea T4]|uniref:Similar to adiponectin receptor-1 n=1 Tax=Botryotinia fuckeliana (strain T4) TaxID=999810 RepID=G2Y571_BOTF4|nr:similar to adiponectin receptor-1 [Botrytis cinerea T4]